MEFGGSHEWDGSKPQHFPKASHRPLPLHQVLECRLPELLPSWFTPTAFLVDAQCHKIYFIDKGTILIPHVKERSPSIGPQLNLTMVQINYFAC